MNTEVVKEFLAVVRKHSPKCFINTQMEIIVEPKNNIYFRLEDVSDKAQMKYKVIAWLSRPACKGTSNYWQYRIRNIVNEYLGTNFDLEQMEAVYTRFGNGCNRDLCIQFIESDYDLSLLEY